MLKLIFKTVLLTILAVLGILLLDNFFYKEHFYRDTINQYQDSNKDFDIVFFGNSHSHSSFDPRIFEIELGAKSINLGSPAQRLVTTKVVIDMVINKGKPDLAVVNIFSLSLNESGNEKYKSFQLETLDFLPNTFEKLSVIYNMFKKQELPTAYSKTLRNHSKWYDISSLKNPYSYSGNYDAYKGFVTYKTSFDSIGYKKFEKIFGNRDTPVTTLKELEKKRIDAIIEIFRKNEIPVLFVNAPDYAYDISDNFKTYAIQISEYLKFKKQNVLDFNLLKDSISLKAEDYRDPNHLNTRGAIKASEFLAKYISKNYTLRSSISENELHKNRYYQVGNDFKSSIESIVFKNQDSLPEGLEKIHVYSAGKNKLEVLFEIDKKTFKDLKVVTQYGTKKNQSLKNKVRSWPILTKKDAITYKNKSFCILTLYPNSEEMHDLKVLTNDKRKLSLINIEYLKLEN